MGMVKHGVACWLWLPLTVSALDNLDIVQIGSSVSKPHSTHRKGSIAAKGNSSHSGRVPPAAKKLRRRRGKHSVASNMSRHSLADLMTLSYGDTCLNFLHIPKTAGSSIEDDSRILASWDKNSGVSGWGTYDTTLKCDRELPPVWDPVHLRNVGFCGLPFGSGADKCDKRHIPPAWDVSMRSAYNSCTTFCVVRDPVHRMISEATYQNIPCEVGALSAWIRGFVLKLKAEGPAASSGASTCHGISQAEYVYGGRAGSFSTPGNYCQRVLKFHDLQGQLSALMQEFNLPITLKSHAKHVGCEVALPADVIALVKERYYMDYEAFGYH